MDKFPLITGLVVNALICGFITYALFWQHQWILTNPNINHFSIEYINTIKLVVTPICVFFFMACLAFFDFVHFDGKIPYGNSYV